MPKPQFPGNVYLIRCTLLGLSYFCLGKFGLSMPYKLSVVTLLWLPIGVAVPAVFRWGWGMLVGVLVGEVAVSLSIVPHWPLALALASGNVLGCVVIVLLLRRFGFNRSFRSRRDTIVWCAACVVGTVIAPVLGPTFLCLAGALPWEAWHQAALMWWLGDLVGVMLAGPVFMVVTRAHFAQWRKRLGEILALAALTAALSGAAFFGSWPVAFSLFHPMLLVVPLQVWAALRFGVVGASSLALGVSFLAAFATSLGQGTFASGNPGAAVFSLWAFAGMVALLSLVITALEAERNQSEATLRKQERGLRTLTDNLPDIIMRLDRDLRVVFINRSVEPVTGLAASRFLGRSTIEAGLPIAPVPEWLAGLHRALATARPEMLEFEFVGGLGPRRWTAQMLPELDEQGAVQSLLIISRDVTERHRLEDQLRQSQKLEAVGTLAGGIAHDFNNILTGIFGNTEMAMMDLPDKAPAQVWLQRVLQAARRARSLVDQILAFSRRQEQKRVPLQVQAIVQEAMQLLRPSIPASIAFTTELPAATPPVMADPGQLHQVLMNLVTNAASAIGPAAGRIDIRVEVVDVDAEAVRQRPQLRCGRFVRLSVSDTGCGMDAATLARIFEPFFTTKKPGTGTGLGLAVVHGIVEQHEGCALVYSEPGKGTTFLIYLPVSENVPAAPLAGNAAEVPSGRGEMVMIVDDEEIVLQVAAEILQRLGYRTIVHHDPEAALQSFTADPHACDLVITDLTMPKLKGTELAAQLWQIRPDLPVVLCTGFNASSAGAGAALPARLRHLAKPFTVEALAIAVAESLGAPPAGAPTRS